MSDAPPENDPNPARRDLHGEAGEVSAAHEASAMGGGPPAAIVRWLAVGIVLAAGFLLILQSEETTPQITRGATAPDFELPRLSDGAQVRLADLRGTVVLVNFWATWCKPCEDEMPSMERLYRELHPSGFEMLAVSVDEETALVREFAARLGISFPVLLDPSQDVSKRFQTMGFPESLLLDRDGVVVERYVGPRDWDHPGFAARIQKLIAGS
jgi:cytochrome c biogenesis protein CcmG/thiol:disulfide interchange protein DsbE